MKFAYRAISTNGAKDAGFVEANSQKDAMRKLASEGKTVFELTQASKSSPAKPKQTKFGKFWEPRSIDPARFFADLAMLTGAGLTISQAMDSLRKFGGSQVQIETAASISSRMASGISASESFGELSGISSEALAMISSGENSGNLPKVFSALAGQMDERAKNRAAFLNALAYPLFLIMLMLAALSVVTFVLVPSIAPVFENSGKEAPFAVLMFVGLRQIVEAAAPILILLIAIAAAALLLPSLRGPTSKKLARLGSHLPVYRSMVLNADLSRYLSSLSMLLENGVPMAQSLSFAAQSASTPRLREELAAVRDSVSSGRRLSDALQSLELFDGRTLSIIAVGNEAGRLPLVTRQAAILLEQNSRKQVERLLAVLTPALTVFMGLVIGGLIVSVMSALLAVNELAVQ